ncbi:phosphatidylinositol-glycan biosynthesis class x protein [Anaeramoeba ignava]|uniref:Phosphatidylinositol-glycan biosynthesis class x protein n=1 Tax=Anaeramoeba ignava TaxID=1746090 RepID=A0A9Q0R7R0_ANAIG|nr:phosphatidylinositol-glycan biosynthesis class x protein [Anaeramoeba ignava]
MINFFQIFSFFLFFSLIHSSNSNWNVLDHRITSINNTAIFSSQAILPLSNGGTKEGIFTEEEIESLAKIQNIDLEFTSFGIEKFNNKIISHFLPFLKETPSGLNLFIQFNEFDSPKLFQNYYDNKNSNKFTEKQNKFINTLFGSISNTNSIDIKKMGKFDNTKLDVFTRLSLNDAINIDWIPYFNNFSNFNNKIESNTLFLSKSNFPELVSFFEKPQKSHSNDYSISNLMGIIRDCYNIDDLQLKRIQTIVQITQFSSSQKLIDSIQSALKISENHHMEYNIKHYNEIIEKIKQNFPQKTHFFFMNMIEIAISDKEINKLIQPQICPFISESKNPIYEVEVDAVDGSETNIQVNLKNNLEELQVFKLNFFDLVEPSKINLEREITLNGFHPTITTSIFFNELTQLNDQCKVILVEFLDEKAFVDMYQLKDLFHQFNGSEVIEFDEINLEKPSWIANQNILVIKAIPVRNNSTQKIDHFVANIPIHLRYQKPSDSKVFRDLLIKSPLVFSQCRNHGLNSLGKVIQMKRYKNSFLDFVFGSLILDQNSQRKPVQMDHQSSWFRASIQNFNQSLLENHLNVPVGQTKDFQITNLITLISTVFAAIVALLVLFFKK